jgi:hypothetical protein
VLKIRDLEKAGIDKVYTLISFLNGRQFWLIPFFQNPLSLFMIASVKDQFSEILKKTVYRI